MGPYGIEQVNVPGLLAAYSSGRAQRVEQMMNQRKMAREEAEEERQIRRDSALAKVFAPQTKGGDPASGGAAPAATAAGASPPATLVDPAQLPPRTDGLTINQDALRELFTYDPGTAKQVQDMVFSANKQQFEQAQRNGEAMATVAWRLKQMPPEARAAELQAWAPQLQQIGLTPEMLARADLTDAGLDRYYATGRKLSEIIAENKPQYMAIPPGGSVVNVRDPAAVSALNSGQPSAAPQPGTIDGGYRFNGGDPADPKSWSPVGGPTPAASGGFPGG